MQHVGTRGPQSHTTASTTKPRNRGSTGQAPEKRSSVSEQKRPRRPLGVPSSLLGFSFCPWCCGRQTVGSGGHMPPPGPAPCSPSVHESAPPSQARGGRTWGVGVPAGVTANPSTLRISFHSYTCRRLIRQCPVLSRSQQTRAAPWGSRAHGAPPHDTPACMGRMHTHVSTGVEESFARALPVGQAPCQCVSGHGPGPPRHLVGTARPQGPFPARAERTLALGLGCRRRSLSSTTPRAPPATALP